MATIPMTLVTGFLGAGKSTLINRMIRKRPDLQFGLVVNEFGDIPIESAIIEAGDDNIIELPNGCMCCVVRDDLASTVAELLDRQAGIEYLILEASGLSDPFPIAQTFLTDSLGDRVHFDAIVTVVDGHNFQGTMDNFTTAIKQLRTADFVVLSKTDTATPEVLSRVKHQVGILAPKVPIIPSDDPSLVDLIIEDHNFDHTAIIQTPLAQVGRKKSLLARPSSRGSPLNSSGLPHPPPREEVGGSSDFKVAWEVRHESVETLIYTSTTPFDFVRLNRVLDDLPKDIIRAKGYLWMNHYQSHGSKTIIQMVCQRTSMDFKPWKDREVRQSALVFIGRTFDADQLRKRLEDALCTPQEEAIFLSE